MKTRQPTIDIFRETSETRPVITDTDPHAEEVTPRTSECSLDRRSATFENWIR